MPEKETLERAKEDAREGKAASTLGGPPRVRAQPRRLQCARNEPFKHQILGGTHAEPRAVATGSLGNGHRKDQRAAEPMYC